MKTDEDILKKVCKQSYLFKNEGHFGTVDIEKAVSLTRKECGLEQTEKIMIAFEKGKQAERKECKWKQQANYNAGFKEGQEALKKEVEKK